MAPTGGFADTASFAATYLGMMISRIISNFNRWHRSGRGMSFDLPPPRPVVGGVVMTDVAEQHAVLSPVYDQAYIMARSNRPEPVISDFIELVELKARIRRVQ